MKKLLAMVLVLAMALSMCATSALAASSSEEADTKAEDRIVEVLPYDNGTGKNPPTGNSYLVYEPEGIVPNGAKSPVIVVMGDESYTKATAAEAVIELGLDKICAENNCYAVFLGPKGDTWTAEDKVYYDEAINLFGELLRFRDAGLFTNAQYVSSQDIIYVIAEGTAADFVAQHVLYANNTAHWADYANPMFSFAFSHLPSGVVLYNPTDDGAAIAIDDLGIAALVVNGSDSLVEALKTANGAEVSESVDGGVAYYNPTSDIKRVVAVKSEVVDGFDGSVLAANLDTVVAVKRSQDGDAFPLKKNLDWDRLGISEDKYTLQTSDTNTLEYRVYVPRNLDISKDGTIPMVLALHGGGENIDIHMASTEYPLLGQEKGFITVAVNQHYTAGSLLDDSNVDQLLAKVFADYPCIDKTRVYASGMSMGAMKSWLLGLNATEYFAGIAPFGAVMSEVDNTGENLVNDYVADEEGPIIPTYYIGGRETEKELPNGSRGSFAQEQVRNLLKRNLVTSSYSYDAQKSEIWGETPDYTSITTYKDGYYVVHHNYYISEDGNTYTVLNDVENLKHECYPFEAAEAWEFLKQFARVDGEIVVLGSAKVESQIKEVAPYDNGTGKSPSTGNSYLVYEPEGITPNGGKSPVIVVMGDESYTKATAAEAVMELGLDKICAENNCYAVFLGPKGDTWTAEDKVYYDEAINLFGEVLRFRDAGLFTNAQYISSQDVIYVFAEGSAADFVTKYVLYADNTARWADYANPTFAFAFSHIPSGVVLYNPTDDGVAIALENLGIAAVVVNGNDELIGALNEANNATASESVSNGTAYYDPAADYKRTVSVTSDVTDGFDGSVLPEHLDMLLDVKRSQNGDKFPLEQNLNWDRLGIDEYKLSLATSEDNTVNYQVYIPRNVDTTAVGTVPLVLSFHGGGETADINMASTHYALLGKEDGFITIAVDQHFSAGTTLDETNFEMFIEKIFADYPCIDQTRVYASGMSMGAIKTWTLSLLATKYFAAIAPFNGVLRDDVSTGPVDTSNLSEGLVLPTFYTAGRITTMPELPNTPEDSEGFVARQLKLILDRNNVIEDYSFDEGTGSLWGIEPTRAEVTSHNDGYYVMHKNYYADANGNELTVLVDIENLGHETYPFVAREAWQFLKQFSRGADGQLFINSQAAEIPADSVEQTTYVVAKGDTLWGIAAKYLGSGYKWSSIYEANKDVIQNPNMIYVGQVLEIPLVK